MIKESIREGKLSIRHNGLLVDSDLEPLQLYVSPHIKKTIKERTKQENMTMDEFMAKLIQKNCK